MIKSIIVTSLLAAVSVVCSANTPNKTQMEEITIVKQPGVSLSGPTNIIPICVDGYVYLVVETIVGRGAGTAIIQPREMVPNKGEQPKRCVSNEQQN